VVVLVLERVFVVGGEVVAATTRVLAGRGRDLDKISVVIIFSSFFQFRMIMLLLPRPKTFRKF
jgi:hypothetical protein